MHVNVTNNLIRIPNIDSYYPNAIMLTNVMIFAVLSDDMFHCFSRTFYETVHLTVSHNVDDNRKTVFKLLSTEFMTNTTIKFVLLLTYMHL